jgi:hypothetical protein
VGATLLEGAGDYAKDMVQHHLLQVGETVAIGVGVTALVLTAPAWVAATVAVAGAALVADEVYEAGKKVMPDLKIIMDGHDQSQLRKAEQRVKANSGQAVFDGLLLVGSVGAGAALRPLAGNRAAPAIIDGAELTTSAVEGAAKAIDTKLGPLFEGEPSTIAKTPTGKSVVPVRHQSPEATDGTRPEQNERIKSSGESRLHSEFTRINKTIGEVQDQYLRTTLEKNFLVVEHSFKGQYSPKSNQAQSALIRHWNASIKTLQSEDAHENRLFAQLEVDLPVEPPVTSTTLKLGEHDPVNLGPRVRKSELTLADGSAERGYFHIFEVDLTHDEVRIANEIAANKLSDLIGLNSGYPTSTLMTVRSADGIFNGWHQPDAGPTLDTFLRERLLDEHGRVTEPHLQTQVLLARDHELHEKIMEATVFRLICGDEDIHARNMTATGNGADARLHNIDLDFAFRENIKPNLKSYGGTLISVGLHKAVANKEIPAEIIGRLNEFLARYDNPLGRVFLQNQLPLTPTQITALLMRTRSLVSTGKIPPADPDFIGARNIRLLEGEERDL